MFRIARYGWRKSNPDARDFSFSAPIVAVPAMVDLRPQCPPVYDQGQQGSCTSQAACAAFEFDLLKQGLPDFTPARDFEYYNTRVLDGDVTTDGGGTIRNANKALAKWGVCPETEWPYSSKDLLKQAPAKVYADAVANAITSYAGVHQDITSMKAVLAGGFPIQIGFTVYDSFESTAAMTTGIVPMPYLTTEGVLGGHAVLICGFADSITVAGRPLTNQFIVRNSWGTSVMDKGYFYMPYAYFTDPNLSSDLWVINAVPGGTPPSPPPPPPITGNGILLTDAFLAANGYVPKT